MIEFVKFLICLTLMVPSIVGIMATVELHPFYAVGLTIQTLSLFALLVACAIGQGRL